MPLSQRTVWLSKTEHAHRAAFVRPSFLARKHSKLKCSRTQWVVVQFMQQSDE